MPTEAQINWAIRMLHKRAEKLGFLPRKADFDDAPAPESNCFWNSDKRVGSCLFERTEEKVIHVFLSDEGVQIDAHIAFAYNEGHKTEKRKITTIGCNLRVCGLKCWQNETNLRPVPVLWVEA